MKVVTIGLLASLGVAACAGVEDGEDEVDTSENTQSIIDHNALSFNRIATNRIATNRIATNRIATNRLSDGRFALDEANAGELLTTADGRELLTYVVGCALTKSQTLVGTAGGVEYTFTGDIGLARTWVNHKLDESDQRWVSACLLSRVNAHDISLLISLRGPNVHLALSDAEQADFTVEEGSFYGNVFVPIERPIIAYACRGLDQALGEPASGNPLGDRDCSEPDPADPTKTQCEFTFTGNCAAFGIDGGGSGSGSGGGGDDDDDDDGGWGCGGHGGHGHDGGHWGGHWGHGGHGEPTVEAHACEDQADADHGGYYKKCHSEASDAHGDWRHNSDRFREVITVYLQP